MLMITRKVGEAIHIGEDIVVVVVPPWKGQSRATVRLGIQAPRDVAIWRAELHPEKSQSFNSALGNKGTEEAV
jgi:carbon storage regulator